MAGLEALIRYFLGNDNVARKTAEKTYQHATQSIDGKGQVVEQLMVLLASNPDEAIRSTSAVLLRQMLVRPIAEPFWSQLPPQARAVVQQNLIAVVESEAQNHVRNKVSDTLSTLASSMLAKGVQWPELTPKLLQWATSDAAVARKAAVTIYGELALGTGRAFMKMMGEDGTKQVRDLMMANLSPPQPIEVREAALGGCAKLLVLLDGKEERDLFAPVLSPMLQCIGDFLGAGDEEAAKKGIELLIEVGENDKLAFFKPHIMPILQAMVTIISTETLEEDTKHLALEFIMTVIEEKPGMVRKKMPELVERVFQVALSWMLTLEEDESWTAASTGESEDITPYQVGLECMDRIAIAIGGKTLMPFAFQTHLPPALSSPQWQTISQISEGCRKAIGKQLSEIVNTVLPYFADPHPRVRFAAINCIGQIASDFSPELQDNYHQIVVPALVQAMGDQHNQVKGHAASCVINFAEGIAKTKMLQYAQAILGQLLQLLSVQDHYVCEQSLTALASMADCLSEHFVGYYDSIMPGLLTMFGTMPSETTEQQGLRCRAMECITVIGVAVGKDKFGADALQLMQFIHQIQASVSKEDDPQASYVQHAYSRICRVLGAEFLPYLQHVMPTLMESARQQEVCVDEDDDAGIVDAEDDDGEGMINIRTSVLEEKCTACGMICCYLEVLEDGMAPYVEECTDLLSGYLEHYADEIRVAAATAMPMLMKAGMGALQTGGQDPKDFVQKFIGKVLLLMLEAIGDEEDMEILQEQLQALGELFQVAGSNCLSDAHQQMVIEKLDNVLKEAIGQRQVRADMNTENAEDLDQEELDQQQETLQAEADVLMMYMQCIGELIKVQQQRVLPHLEQTIQIFIEMLKPEYSAQDRKLALLVLDDVIEYGGDLMKPLLPVIAPAFVSYLEDPDGGVRQAAAYGVGQMAEHGADIFAPHAANCVQILSRIISAPNSRAEGCVHATDNTISAFGKFLEFQTAALGNDAQMAMRTWVSWLPVTGDLEEAKIIYNRLISFCERDMAMMAGPNNDQLGKIITVLVDALGTEAVDDKLTARIQRLMQMLNTQMAQALQLVASSLTAEQTTKVQTLLS